MPPTPSPTAAAPPIRWAWRDFRPGTAAETLARAWLGEMLALPDGAVPLRRDRHGRPRLDQTGDGLDVSWSHSSGGLLLALGEGVRLGVDLERLRPRPRALALARRYFTAAEADWLAAHNETTRMPAFVRLWCAKEALLKAHGRGLSFGLGRLEFAERDGKLVLVACDRALGVAGDWQLREWTPQAGYHAALAWRPA